MKQTQVTVVSHPTREAVKLRRDFVKGQKYTLHDLQAEIAANHFSTAHRLVHTLKCVAGLINEPALVKIALKTEQKLKKRQRPSAEEMKTLERELNRVLTEITNSGIMDEETLSTPPTIEEQSALFDKVLVMLKDDDAACVDLIPELTLIPETKVLIRQIENYAFAPALVTLKVLREVLEV